MHHHVPAVEGHHEALREELDVGGVQEEDEVVLDVGHRGGGGLCPPFELLAMTFFKNPSCAVERQQASGDVDGIEAASPLPGCTTRCR